jgi:hypothetical protein
MNLNKSGISFRNGEIKMSQFSILKVNENEYLLSMANIPRKLIRKIEEDNFHGARIRHMVSSSVGYSVYEIYGEEAGVVAAKIEKFLANKAKEVVVTR